MKPIERKLELLQKPFWTLKDIVEYTGFSRNRAELVKKQARKIQDNAYLPSSAVHVEAALKVLGKDITKEIRKLKELQK